MATPSPLLAALMILACGAAEGPWTALGLSGGGSMFGPAISPADPRCLLVHCDMSGAYRSQDGGRTWTLIHADQLQGNTVCQPAWHPTDALVAVSPHGWEGRLRITRDGGRTWTALGGCGGRPWGMVCFDPATPSRLLLGLEDGAALTLDSGATWRRCAGPRGNAIGGAFDRTSPADRRLAFIATVEGVWRSVDGGTTWAVCNQGLPVPGLRGFAAGFTPSLSRLYATLPCTVENGQLRGGIYVSADLGLHWSAAMNRGLNLDLKPFDQWAMGPVVQYHQVLCRDADPLRVYACNANTGVPPPHHTAVYRSDDGGASWRPTFFPDPRWPGFNYAHDWTVAGIGQFYQAVPYGAAIGAGDPDLLVLTDAGNCIISGDGGGRWFPGHARPARPVIDVKAKRIPGSEWLDTGLGVTTTWNYHIDPHDVRRHYLCYTDIGFARSLDGGRTWRWWGDGQRSPWGNTCYELALDPAVPGRMWGAFSETHDIPNDNVISGRHRADRAGGVCVSTDFAEGWKPCSQGVPAAPVTSIILDPASPKEGRTLFAGVFGHGVFTSCDGGASWSPCGALGSAANRRVVRVALHQDGTLFALITALRKGRDYLPDGPGLWRSRDRGLTWELANAGKALRWPKDFAVDPADSRRLVIAAADAGGQDGGVWDSRDGGATWSRILRQGPQHFSVAFSPHHRGWIYATLCEGAPGPGLWLSRDDGATWAPFAELPFRNIQRVAFDPQDASSVILTTFGWSAVRGPAEPGRR